MHVDQEEIQRGIEPFIEGLRRSLEYASRSARITASMEGRWAILRGGPGIKADLLIVVDGSEYRIQFEDTSAAAPFAFAGKLAKAEEWVNRAGAESLAPAGD